VDLTSQVTTAINAWLENLVKQLLSPAIDAAGNLLLQAPRLDAVPVVVRNWEIARGISDALLVLGFLGAGVLVIVSSGAEARYSAKILIPRIVLAGVLANASLAICGALITLSNALVSGLLGPSPAASVAARFSSIVLSASGPNQIIAIVVGLASAALAILLVALFLGRDLLLMLAMILAPLALLMYALPQTEELARLWWRVFCALLFVQVVQAALVNVGMDVLANANWFGEPASGIVSGLLVITLLYLLLRLPFAAYGWAFRQSLTQSRVVHSVVLGARSLAAL